MSKKAQFSNEDRMMVWMIASGAAHSMYSS